MQLISSELQYCTSLLVASPDEFKSSRDAQTDAQNVRVDV